MDFSRARGHERRKILVTSSHSNIICCIPIEYSVTKTVTRCDEVTKSSFFVTLIDFSPQLFMKNLWIHLMRSSLRALQRMNLSACAVRAPPVFSHEVSAAMSLFSQNNYSLCAFEPPR